MGTMENQAQDNHFAGDCAKEIFLQASQLQVLSEPSYILHPIVNSAFWKQQLPPQAFAQKSGS